MLFYLIELASEVLSNVSLHDVMVCYSVGSLLRSVDLHGSLSEPCHCQMLDKNNIKCSGSSGRLKQCSYDYNLVQISHFSTDKNILKNVI